MFGGVGFDLGAIETDLAQLQDVHLPCDEKDLNEQRLELRKKALAKGSDSVVIGMIVSGYISKGHGVVSRPLQLVTGKNSCRIAVEQQGQQHLRVMGLGAPAGIGGLDRHEVKLLDDLDDEAGQMPFGQPVVH